MRGRGRNGGGAALGGLGNLHRLSQQPCWDTVVWRGSPNSRLLVTTVQTHNRFLLDTFTPDHHREEDSLERSNPADPSYFVEFRIKHFICRPLRLSSTFGGSVTALTTPKLLQYGLPRRRPERPSAQRRPLAQRRTA